MIVLNLFLKTVFILFLFNLSQMSHMVFSHRVQNDAKKPDIHLKAFPHSAVMYEQMLHQRSEISNSTTQ